MTRFILALLLACACSAESIEPEPYELGLEHPDVTFVATDREYARVEIAAGPGYLELCNSTVEERARCRRCVLVEPGQSVCLFDETPETRVTTETTDAYSLSKRYPDNCPGAWDRPL